MHAHCPPPATRSADAQAHDVSSDLGPEILHVALVERQRRAAAEMLRKGQRKYATVAAIVLDGHIPHVPACKTLASSVTCSSTTSLPMNVSRHMTTSTVRMWHSQCGRHKLTDVHMQDALHHAACAAPCSRARKVELRAADGSLIRQG